MARLEQKTAVITGASSGIGKGIALAYAREGAHVIVNYNRSREKSEQIVEEIISAGGKAEAIQANTGHQDDIERLIRESEKMLGHIDIWVNNAGADVLTGAGAELDDQEKLQNLINQFREGASELGLNLVDSKTAIQPIVIGSSEQALTLSEKLFEKNILISAIRPPTVPEGTARLRITFSATHTEEQVDKLLTVLSEVK